MTRFAWLGSILVTPLAVVSCSQGAEPEGRIRPGSAQDTSETRPTEGGAPAFDAGSDADASVTAPIDGGQDAAPDAGPPNAFTGAGAYAAKTGPSTRKASHGANQNPAGRPCLNCHGGGGGATTFTLGGTVYRNAGGTMPAAQAEIRVRDKDGEVRSVFTDADGNFFLPLNPNGDLAFPALVGARDATTTNLMKAAIAGGNCNDCHKPAAAGRLVLP